MHICHLEMVHRSLLPQLSRVCLGALSSLLHGSVCFVSVEIRHLKHLFTVSAISNSIPGHQYLCRIISLVLDSPKCPCLCAIRTIFALIFSGGTILLCRRITFSDSYSSACIHQCTALGLGLSCPKHSFAWHA